MKRAQGLCVLAACGALLLGAGGVGAAALDDSTIALRGAGKTREALNAMQLKPFDASAWGQLSNWTGGEFKPADAEGKVVMIVTWASWYPASHRAMRAAQAAYTQHKDKGLIVLGVHNPRGFEGAAANIKDMGVTFPYAEDKDGKFRNAILAGQDSNVYFIDRSGNMRFAQVEGASVAAAAELLVKETVEQAKAIPGKLADAAAAAEKEKWLTRDRTGLAPGEVPPAVEFKEPDEDAYTAAKWPYLLGKVERDPILEKVKNDAPRITNWPEEDWIPSTPRTKGKIRVLYLMDPQDPPMLLTIPTMNTLADQYPRDVVVIGSLFKWGAGNLANTQGGGGSGGDDDEKLKERNRGLAKSIMATHSVNHYLNPTVLKAENLEFTAGSMSPRIFRSNDGFGIVMLLSTDNRIRWIGNPNDPAMRIAIDKLIAVDPAVQARRKAEDAKMKSK